MLSDLVGNVSWAFEIFRKYICIVNLEGVCKYMYTVVFLSSCYFSKCIDCNKCHQNDLCHFHLFEL